MSEKVLVDRELLAKASMLPSMKSLEENRRDIVERGRSQAAIRELLAAPAAPAAQAEQEPVAWIRKNGFRFIAEIEPQDDSEVPLYAAPPAQPDAALAGENKRLRKQLLAWANDINWAATHAGCLAKFAAITESMKKEALK